MHTACYCHANTLNKPSLYQYSDGEIEAQRGFLTITTTWLVPQSLFLVLASQPLLEAPSTRDNHVWEGSSLLMCPVLLLGAVVNRTARLCPWLDKTMQVPAHSTLQTAGPSTGCKPRKMLGRVRGLEHLIPRKEAFLGLSIAQVAGLTANKWTYCSICILHICGVLEDRGKRPFAHSTNY